MWQTGMPCFGYGNWIFLVAAYNLFTYAQGNSEPALYVRFTAEPSDLIALPGAPASLPCAAESAGQRSAPARIRWRFRADATPAPDDMLSTGDADRQQLINGTLSIPRMSARAAGRYQCVASVDGVGTIVSREALLMIAELPSFPGAPRLVVGSAGAPALLPCTLRAPPRASLRVLGNSPPVRSTRTSVVEPPLLRVNVTWLRNGMPVLLDARAQLTPSGALELDPAHAHDAGTYTCRVSLPGLPQQRDGPAVELRVAEDTGAEAAPRFVAAPSDQTIMEGASVTLDCCAAGHPRPEVVWLHNGAVIDLSSLDSRHRLVGSGSLQLLAARAVDSGLYTCRATTPRDTSDVTAQLHVQSIPRVSTPDAPVLFARVAGSVRLRCTTRGRPPPRLAWLKDGEPLSTNQRDLDLPDGSSLRIAGVLPVDSGMFQCVGTSPAGTTTAGLRLAPLPPEHDPSPAPYSPKSLFDSLRPTAEEDSPLLPEGEESESLAEYPDDIAFAYTETPEVLFGNYLEDISINGSTALVSAPRELRALLVKPRFVTLGWQPPGQQHDNVTGYLLAYRVDGSRREMVSLGGATRHELNVGGLAPDTKYSFSVRATARSGLSQPSESITVLTPGEESAHLAPAGLRVESAAAHSMVVSWEAPPSSPDTYTLHYTEEETGRSQQVWTRAGVTSVTLTGLRADAPYALRVSAGGGAASDELRARTAPAPPQGPPRAVAVETAGPTSLTVRWEPPAAPAPAPAGYRLRYRPTAGSGGGSGGRSLAARADQRSIELKGLEHTSYQVRVCVTSANGSGPCSGWVTAPTVPRAADSAVPPPPPPLATRAGVTWVGVRWGGPGGGSVPPGGGSGWALGWGLGVPDETARDLPAQARSYVIRDLQPNAEYVISLRASNSLGLGPPVYATVRTLAPGARGGDEPGDGEGEEEDEEEDEDDEEEESEEEPLLPPLGLKVIMLSGTTAVVYWTDPTLPKGQTATDGRRYVVRYGAATPGARPRVYNASDLNCMLDDLRPFTKYDFAVKLIKGERESPWSMLVSNTTLPAPPGPPRDPRASPASGGRAVELAWDKPARPNGVITGYVVMYAVISAEGVAGEWTALALGGERRGARVERLRPNTHYQFRVQARTSAGLGPASAPVAAKTGEETGGAGAGLAGATSAWLWASAGGACAVLALAAALALSLCCRGAQPAEELSTYQKASASTGIKPPDLWIHHDQMELKHLDKSLHSSNISGGSAEGLMGGAASTLTLSRPEYEPARAQPASLDRRCYVPTYVAMSGVGGMGSLGGTLGPGGSISGTLGPGGTMSGTLGPGGGMGGTIGAGGSLSGTLGPGGGGGGSGCGACGGVCERRHPRLPHPMHLPEQGGPLASPQSSLASGAPLQPPPCAGGDVYAAASAARERGHYVAYEPLGHYTHRDSLSSEGGGGPGGPGSAGAVGSRAGSLRRPPAAPLHSFTPPHDPTGRETSPYKSAGSSPGHAANRLQMGAVPACASELEPLTPSRSTERLQREMHNLEGLMRDLSAITQQQFHC